MASRGDNPHPVHSQELEATGCLSDQKHGPKDIKDHLQHYFGCLEIADRCSFLAREIPDGPVSATDPGPKKMPNPIWEHEAKFERELLQADGVAGATLEQKVAEQLDKRIGSLAVAIEAQYKRTQILRQALLDTPNPRTPQDQTPNARPSPDTHGHLVHNVINSYDNWRNSEVCQEGLKKVRTFRVNQGKALVLSSGEEMPRMNREVQFEPERERVREVVKKYRKNFEDETAPYELERDVNAYLIQYTTSKPESGTLEPVEEAPTDVRFKGRFPNQRVSMSELLKSAEDKKKSILSKSLAEKNDPNRIRYFHIPSNNMYWVERVIAGYYDDTDKSPDLGGGSGDFASRTKTNMLLRPHLWRGQQNGARSGVVHARYMRPLCERVSSEVSVIEDNPANIVMFMPYMHWETDRMRAKISTAIDDESRKQRQKQERESTKRRTERQEERKRHGLDPIAKRIVHPEERPNQQLLDRLETCGEAKKKGALARSATEVFGEFIRIPARKEIEIDQNGRLVLKNENPLGQYLLDAARLYEAMSTFRDQQMLENYLYHSAPLHPRRTLDQSHYWTLKSTKARDRDQVVYRGTSMDVDNCHSLRLLEPEPAKERRLTRWIADMKPKPEPKSSEPKSKYQWEGHWKRTDEPGCEHCRNDIRRISQIIMVDQLWMWVLDDHTIITSFPKRYGYNKHDLSGIHKSIRQRLTSARKNQIRSVYDLALVILDECSNTFFDQTKTEDSQPRVMDIFSESIGNVTSQHTISFQHVWHWTKEASKMYRSKSKYADSSKLHVPLLDIHPEGKLQREVKDIIDELDMMMHIQKKQREMFRRFCKHVEHLLDPEGRWREGGPLAGDTEREVPTHAVEHLHDTAAGSSPKHKQDKKKLFWFRIQSQELLSEADDRVDELEGLRKAAESTAQSVNDLLSLKQQQASVVQAWESAKQAEEAVRQGRSIMMFTIVTVVFLPLSFMTSFFGMNNIEFGSDGTSWTMGAQTKLIVLVSFGIVLMSVILAFSNLLRAIIWSGWRITSMCIITTLPIYKHWLSWSDDWRGTSLMKRTEEKANKWKEDVRRAKKLGQYEKEAAALKKARKDEEEKKKSPGPSLSPTSPAANVTPAPSTTSTGIGSTLSPPPRTTPTQTASAATGVSTIKSPGRAPSRQRHPRARHQSPHGSSSTGGNLPNSSSSTRLGNHTNNPSNQDSSTRLQVPSSAADQLITPTSSASTIDPRFTGSTLANFNTNPRHDVNGDDNNV
ncbi:hypothetical protein V8F06_013941 [Rhypophila decipiens]